MNTPNLQKSLALFSFLMISPITFCANGYHFALETTITEMDTGDSTKTVAAPQLGLYLNLGQDDTHRLGIVYTHLSFSNRIEWINDEPPYPDRIDSIIDSGSIVLNQFKLAYRLNLNNNSNGIRIFVTPTIGIGRISESGIHTVTGGISGGRSEVFGESEWDVTLSGGLGFEWDMSSNWRFGLSGGYLYQATGEAVLYSNLSGPQGTVSLTCSF